MTEPAIVIDSVLAAGTVTSPANPRVRAAARLRNAGDRRETGLTLVDGLRELDRCLRAGVELVEVFVAADRLSPPTTMLLAILAELVARKIPLLPLADRPFTRVSFGGRNEGVVAVARFCSGPLTSFAAKADQPIFILEGVEKPGNLGAILRSADATGCGGVIACGAGTDAANPAVIRASLGTVFSMPLATATTAETIKWCADRNRPVIAATPEGSCRWCDVALGGNEAILLGSEAHGISTAWCDAASAGSLTLTTVALPMLGVADSLNVSATAAVLAYESLRQRQKID
jgi:TrmH family RNA methyltransferase